MSTIYIDDEDENTVSGSGNGLVLDVTSSTELSESFKGTTTADTARDEDINVNLYIIAASTFLALALVILIIAFIIWRRVKHRRIAPRGDQEKPACINNTETKDDIKIIGGYMN
uniref:Uncharacterized protein n=1 Tax=Arion vulgaris TaxID=1028688 RepID=A0A0B7AUG3_9EUPU